MPDPAGEKDQQRSVRERAAEAVQKVIEPGSNRAPHPTHYLIADAVLVAVEEADRD